MTNNAREKTKNILQKKIRIKVINSYRNMEKYWWPMSTDRSRR